MKYAIALMALLLTSTGSPGESGVPVYPRSEANPEIALKLAQVQNCARRRYCTQMRSCAEAVWYYQNCSWGWRLDGDSDGVPCERLCR